MFDHIKIASPCSADWDRMEGTDRVRFCPECFMIGSNASRRNRNLRNNLRHQRRSGHLLQLRSSASRGRSWEESIRPTVGRYKRTYKAVLELNRIAKAADSKILAFCALIRCLPKAERRLWNKAKERDFNIGIQVGARPFSERIALRENAVKAAAELGARIVFTVYPPNMPVIDAASVMIDQERSC